MPADRAEALDRDARALRAAVAVARGDLGGVAQPPAGGADLVERDAAERSRQADRAPDLVLHPRHAGLVGAHVGAEDVVVSRCAGRGRRRGSAPPCVLRGMRGSPHSTDLPPPCARPAAAFFRVMARARRKHSSTLTSGRHAQAADRRAAGDVVHHQHRLQPERRLVDLDDLGRPEVIGKLENPRQVSLLISRSCQAPYAPAQTARLTQVNRAVTAHPVDRTGGVATSGVRRVFYGPSAGLT